MIWGAEPVRTWDRSSSKVTSLTQCTRFSMPQCPRHKARSLGRVLKWGVVRLDERLPDYGDDAGLVGALG